MEKTNNTKIVKTDLSHLPKMAEIQRDYPHQILSLTSIQNDIISDNCYYISALINNELVGFAGISILVDHVDILAVIVNKKFTKQGIATLMIDNIISFCIKNNLQKIFLEVRNDNYPAINLYEKFGFKKINTRKNYYKDDNSDALIYMKEL